MISNAPASSVKHHSPIPSIALGLFMLFLSLAATTVQIATSEAFQAGDTAANVKPNFGIFMQIPAFFNGSISAATVPPFMWAYFVECMFLIGVIGFEIVHGILRSSNRWLGNIFIFIMISCFALNAYSDFQYTVSNNSGTGGRIAFALAVSGAVLFFGVGGIGLIERGIKEWMK